MELDKAFIESFIEEALTILEKISEIILKDEITHEDVKELFRSFHTLKSLFAAVGYTKTKDLIHKYEDILAEYRDKGLGLPREEKEKIASITNLLEEITNNIEKGEDYFEERITELLNDITQPLKSPPVEIKAEMPKAPVGDKPKIKITLSQDELLVSARMALILQKLKSAGVESTLLHPSLSDIESGNVSTRELLIEVKNEDLNTALNIIKNMPGVALVEVIEAKEKKGAKPSVTKELISLPKTIRIESNKLDTLLTIVEDLTVLSSRLTALTSKINNEELASTVSLINKSLGKLRDEVLSMRMLPLSYIFSRIPRIALDLSRKLGKKVDVIIEGGEVEIDKASLEKLYDPIIHIVRNALDHGIEPPEERIKLGKPEVGKIYVRAYRSTKGIVIEIEDDGRGIDINAIKQKVVDKGLATLEEVEKMSDEELLSFLFISGFSTSSRLTDVSGRGVGLDVVKNIIESLGGTVSLHTEKGVGTKITMVLPPTLLILRAIVVTSGGIKWAIPVEAVKEIFELSDVEIKRSVGGTTVYYRGKIIPVVSLSKIFGIGSDQNNYLVVCGRENIVGITISEIYTQTDVVVKPLPKILRGIHTMSGVTILEDGSVVPIIDPDGIYEAIEGE